jgi:hypothetical protein
MTGALGRTAGLGAAPEPKLLRHALGRAERTLVTADPAVGAHMAWTAWWNTWAADSCTCTNPSSLFQRAAAAMNWPPARFALKIGSKSGRDCCGSASFTDVRPR